MLDENSNIEKPQNEPTLGGEKAVSLVENKERIITLQRPIINEFPKKAQPVIKEAFEHARDLSNVFDRLLSDSIAVINTANSKQYDKDEVKKLSEEAVPEDKVAQNRVLEMVIEEINRLKAAFLKLHQGKDAPELRDVPNPFNQFDYRNNFTDQDINTYGEVRKLSSVFKKAKALTHPKRFSEEKNIFMEKMQQLFRQRTSDLFQYGLWESTNRPNFYRVELQALHQALSTPEDDRGKEMISGFDTYFNAAKEVAKQSSAYSYFLDIFQGWLGNHKEDLNNLSGSGNLSVFDNFGNELDSAVRQIKKDYDQNKKTFLGRSQNYTNWVEDYMHMTNKRFDDLSKKIADGAFPIDNPGFHETILKASSLSQDYISLSRHLQNRISEVTQLLEKLTDRKITNGSRLQWAFDKIAGIVLIGEYQSTQEQELGKSTDLLFHVGPIDALKAALSRKTLGSRKYQIDNYGESTFTSGSLVKVGKDYVIASDYYGYSHKYRKDVYNTTAKRIGHKLPDQEAHQVCFSENSPYMYYQGIALVFSKSSLFSQAQFMQQDGWHLFNKDYSHDDNEAPGFAIDLTKEPFLIVVSEESAEDIRRFMRNELSKDPKWGVENIEGWLDSNIVIVPNAKAHDFTKASSDEVINRFSKAHSNNGSRGWIVPTGENGETAVRSLAPLFTYKLVS